MSRLGRAAALAALSLTLAAGGCEWLTGDFRLAGSVEIAPQLEARAPKTNAVLFVVAHNAGGVPLAVSRIVNPEFPAPFVMRSQDLLVPAIRRDEVLLVTAQLNGHGNLGLPQHGDIEGKASGPARPGDRGVRVKLDKLR